MAQAICRCGQPLAVPLNGSGSERVVCPGCGAKVRVRVRRSSDKGGHGDAPAAPEDGFIRFFCGCGKRLKVSATDPPAHGKCPDCGAVVPVPSQAGASPSGSASNLPPGHPETPTADLGPADLAALERWARDHLARAANATDNPSTASLDRPPADPAALAPRAEAGLRICPRCGRPIHLGAESCRACGTAVPKLR